MVWWLLVIFLPCVVGVSFLLWYFCGGVKGVRGVRGGGLSFLGLFGFFCCVSVLALGLYSWRGSPEVADFVDRQRLALDGLRLGVEQFPDDVSSWVGLSQPYIRVRDWRGAGEVLDRGLELHGVSPELLWFRGLVAVQGGESYDDIESYFLRLEDLLPDDVGGRSVRVDIEEILSRVRGER